MRDLEEQLVVVRALGLRLLEREQLVRAEIALVVARTGAGKDRAELVFEPRLLAPGHVLSILRHRGRSLCRCGPGAASGQRPPGPARAAGDARRVRRPAARARRSLGPPA